MEFEESGFRCLLKRLRKICLKNHAAYLSFNADFIFKIPGRCFLNNPSFDIHKNIFACLSSVHNIISLSWHKQVCLIRLRFERYFSHHWEKYLSKFSLIKHTCSWRDNPFCKTLYKRPTKNTTATFGAFSL